jgi:heme a synthase
MPSAPSAVDLQRRAVRVWLLTVAALVLAMVVVGGATRLTESGLSITEWQPIAGALPPLTSADWQAAFDKYKAIPQYRALNPGMTLEAFKQIYWWEWTHRLLGRVIGAAFLVPFLWFLWRGFIAPAWRARLWGLFALGAFQGAVGWWMVASGLADRTEVSQYRLAFHLLLACVIYVAMIWTALGLAPRGAPDVPRRLRAGALGLLGLALAQIYLGALVAGLRAGHIFNTWPLIEGRWVPHAAQLFFSAPWWRNVFENPLTAQFDHRMLAYAILIVASLHAIDAAVSRPGRGAVWGAVVVLAAVTVQAALGIATLLLEAPFALALAHQAMAMIVLTVVAVHAQRLSGARRAAGEVGASMAAAVG